MKQIITNKMMRKCLILAFMIVGLVFVASSNKFVQPTVAAMPCCEECAGDGDPEISDYLCGFLCNSASLPTQAAWQQCKDACDHESDLCYRHCMYCSGYVPGGSCTGTSDCAANQYCGADDLCHYW